MLKHSSYSYFACNLAWPHNKRHQSLIKLNQFNSGMHTHTYTHDRQKFIAYILT